MNNGETILKSISKKSHDHEFYTPVPKGYKVGKSTYVVVFGTVMSGLGKGIFSSSLAHIMQTKGLSVAPMKFDGYLNVDAGTLNPYRHGEVFVLDDGTETDMDLGNYERFLNLNLLKDNYLTGGKIFDSILNRERKGNYLGRDVQFIPHVTGEIKRFLRNLAMRSKADIVFVEVGGTVGDIENMYFIEAIRELTYEEKGHVCNIALTYVLEPGFLGEQKSKAAQLGLRNLMSLGIQPNIVACRSTHPISETVREKISIYSNVPVENVVGVHDVSSTYLIPALIDKTNIADSVIEELGLKSNVNLRKGRSIKKAWDDYVRKLQNRKREITIGITGKYTALRDSYASILNALEHAGTHNNARVNVKWIEVTEIEKGKLSVEKALKGVYGVIVPGGFGARGIEGKIACVRYLREKKIPYLGLCYGFQMALIEFARNVLKITDANTTEVKSGCKNPVIDILPEQKKIEGLGGNMRLGGHDIAVKKGTKAYTLYGNKTMIRERFRHRYECNPKYIKDFEQHGIVFSGKAPKYPIMQVLELQKHPFFIGVQYHPEFTSRPTKPNPLFFGFVKAAKSKAL